MNVLILIFVFYFFTFVHSQEHDNCTAFTLIEAGFSVFDRNKGQVCCPMIGCFANQSPDSQNRKIDNRSSNINHSLSIDHDWKFWQHIARLPFCPDQIRPQFYCFSNSDSTDRHKLIDYENLDLDGPKLAWKKNKQETVIIIHGWKTDWPSPWMNKMRDAFLGIDKRVVLVRWSNGSNVADYAQGAVNTRVVGASVARFVQRMIAFGKFDLESVIVVGFSLGAQAAGFAAKKMPGLTQLVVADQSASFKENRWIVADEKGRLNQWIIARKVLSNRREKNGRVFKKLTLLQSWITRKNRPQLTVYCTFLYASQVFYYNTGLDPAGPLFACQNSKARIDVSDAKRVLIFHTNGKNPLLGGRGTMQQLGHLDFYVNGGAEQPDCDKNGVVPKKYIDVLSIDVKTLWSTMSCNHQRAPAVYTEIIEKSPKILQHKSGFTATAADPKPASCSFLAFPCNSTKQWTNGRCFETCEKNGVKTMKENAACLRPSYILDDTTTVKRKWPEKYFFDLRIDGNDSEFCGRPVRVALKVSKEVKGTIKANFVSKSSRIDNKNSNKIVLLKLQKIGSFLSRSKKLKPESSNSSSHVVILPWTMTLQNLQFLEINYVPDRSLWAKVVNDKKDFVLNNVAITDLLDSKLQSCGDQIITMAKVNRIMLKMKC